MTSLADRYGELIEVIGETALVDLAEAFGGTRLNVPVKISASHEIAKAIGIEAARELARHYAPDVVRVPLARELRAKRYRSEGLSAARIAVRLGITETGVNKLFKRLGER